MANFYTSDWHLFHHNIIKYSNRPFANTAMMNKAIQDGINSMVTANDWLYNVGDLGFTDTKTLAYWLDGLVCKNICIVWGNHDKPGKQLWLSGHSHFYWVKDLAEVEDEGQLIVLCHYAMRVWRRSHRGSWHLYGHSHGSLPDDPNSLSMDVGVDTNNFLPYSFADIQKRMLKKTFKPIDHHKEKYEQSN